MKVSVILSTYNQPKWLEKVIWGYECQSYKDFELVIADDGSGPETIELIKRYKQNTALNIVHVWHEDRGFQKSEILNKATKASQGDYLIFSDGDCIPRQDFVATHISNAKPGFFLSGGYFMLPAETSSAITKEDITSGRSFQTKWLYSNGLKRTYKTLKFTTSRILQKLLNGLTPTKATWNGHSSSGWRKDIIGVNGFNEEMQYGGQDRELGERLVNCGIIGKQIRYSAVCIHLDHKRGYKTKESISKNKKIRQETRTTGRTWTPHGIEKTEEAIRS